MNHSTATLLVLAVAMASLTACSDPQPDATGTTPPTLTSTAPEPTRAQSPTSEPTTQTPDPLDTLDPDQVAAREVVDAFFRISDELKRDPNLPLQPLADITTGQTQIVYLKEIQDYRAMNAVRTGEVLRVVTSVGVATERETEKVVTVEACTDASDSDVVDSTTNESILPEDRQPVTLWAIEAVTENGVWKVGDLSTSVGQECQA